jgi:hypothetical protein
MDIEALLDHAKDTITVKRHLRRFPPPPCRCGRHRWLIGLSRCTLPCRTPWRGS